MKRGILAVFVVLVLTASASASYIDFRMPAFSGAHGASSFGYTTADGLGITLTALPAVPGTVLWQDENDGIGITSTFGYEPDEIEGAEILRLDFSNTVYLHKVHLSDLFNEHGYLEIGFIYPSETITEKVMADPSQISGWGINGDLWFEFEPNLMADFILFTAPGRVDGQHHEFSVEGVDVSVVPVPPAVLLLGSGILGLAAFRRRRHK